MQILGLSAARPWAIPKKAVIAFFTGLGERMGQCMYSDVGCQLGKGKIPLIPWAGLSSGCDSPRLELNPLPRPGLGPLQVQRSAKT